MPRKQSFLTPSGTDNPVFRPTQSLEIPQNKGTADLIMQAWELNQQQDKQRQDATQALISSLNTINELGLRRQKQQMDLDQENATLELKKAQEKRDIENKNLEFQLAKERIGLEREKIGLLRNKIPSSRDPNRLLNLQEQQAYGVGQGTTAKDVEGRVPLSPSNREKIAQLTSAAPLVKSLEDIISTLDLGETTAGAAAQGVKLNAKALARNTDEGQFLSARKNISNLVRAMGERGVLTDTDVSRITNDLPTFFDTKKSANQRISRIKKIMSETQSNLRRSFKGDILSGQKNQVDERQSILDEINSLRTIIEE